MNDVLIQVTQLSCKVGTRHLLNQINWTVHKGEQWVIFGMNGSGKTTLLSVIAGYRNYTRGKVELFGESITADNVLRLRKRIGWVSSSFFDSYYKNESVLEIVLAGKTGTLGLDVSLGEADVQAAKALLRQVHLEEKCNMPFCTLSKGERQNILLVRALLTKPEILILDEPCSGLDIVAREHVLKMVRNIIQQTETTIVYVTHYPEEILDIFTNVMLLKKGKIFLQGDKEACFCSEKISAFLEERATVDRDKQNRLQIRFEPSLLERRENL